MTVQSSRTASLADQFDSACLDFRATVERVPDSKWNGATPNDGRPVNVVAHHAAGAHSVIAQLIQAMIDGKPAAFGMQQIHAGNAQHARQFADCTRAEVLELHDREAAKARAWLREVDDAQLATPGEFLIGAPSTVQQAIERVLIGHPLGHTETIRGALVE